MDLKSEPCIILYHVSVQTKAIHRYDEGIGSLIDKIIHYV